eukprot:1159745-Pelagomonas_calceolata.AAC.11
MALSPTGHVGLCPQVKTQGKKNASQQQQRAGGPADSEEDGEEQTQQQQQQEVEYHCKHCNRTMMGENRMKLHLNCDMCDFLDSTAAA